MAMTKKDYETIAKVFHNFMEDISVMKKGPYQLGSANAARVLADDMADVLADTNPRFDRERFLEACGI